MLKIAQKIKNGECPVLCFFGDSITDGQFEFANGHKKSVRHEEWVFWNILRNRIREEIGQEVSIVNAGVGGNFSKDGLARIQQDVLERKPDFCCVMFGTNDVTNAYKGDSALQEYEKNMEQILIRLRESNIETVLMTPGMLCKHRVKGFWGFWWYIHRYFENLQKAGHMDAYVAKIREIANQLDIPIADAYAEWQLLESQGVDTTALLANGLNHPNAEMHKVFVNKLYDVIFM